MLFRWPVNGHRTPLSNLLHARGQIPAKSRSVSTFSHGSRKYTWFKGVGYLAVAGGSVYAVDRQFNASAVGRNVRTLYTGAIIAADYKLNFKPSQGEKIVALHERVAERLYNLLIDNGGLYIKIGQAIAANTALLPAPFQTRFGKLFDEAPQVPYADIERVFISEFGKPPAGEGGVFEEFEEQAVASASIAQVHRARLKKQPGADGDTADVWVAVKVQKPAVSKQVNLDLAANRALMWMYEKWIFDLPIYFTVDFITSHLLLELDFLNEARNAEATAALVAKEPRLAGKVYVPKVYREYTTAKVMTAEYIDGVKLSDRRAIRRLLDGASLSSSTSVDPNPNPSAKPNWDGSGFQDHNPYSNRPIRGGARAIMETLVSLFSVQIFQWGFVHCDPHPGNIIIRRLIPSNEAQLVLIDHGLYVQLPEDLRTSYARLWKGMLSGDFKEVRAVAASWGIGAGSEDLLASGVLLKPWRSKDRANENGNGGEKEVDQYERSLIMKKKLRQFLTDTERFPQALIFLGRNMRMVQGNNQALGSPVNRVKIIGNWASRSLATAPNLTLSQRLIEYWHHVTYLSVIFVLDVAFWISKFRQWTRGGLGGSFEDELEREMRRISKENFGVELGEGAFNG